MNKFSSEQIYKPIGRRGVPLSQTNPFGSSSDDDDEAGDGGSNAAGGAQTKGKESSQPSATTTTKTSKVTAEAQKNNGNGNGDSGYESGRDRPIPTIENTVPTIEDTAESIAPREAKMSKNFVPTNRQRHLRACMICSIVMETNRFYNEGCPNCTYLPLQYNNDMITDCTSPVFEGLITLADPTKSWVAKWQRLDGYVVGVYATKVSGLLGDNAVQLLEDAGVRYIPRDGSATEAD